ncbi:MAG TPA: peptidoglycan binding domain-containing protein, partial [Acidimicrobiales bacterium]|nr:peptidoglycan binding domain-containing protein [Acidimicrobiales bacterium]
MRRILKFFLIGLAVAAGLLGAIVAAWTIDTRGAHTRVARNVTLAGRPVGGLSRAALTAVVQRVTDDYKATRVVVTAPNGSFVTDTTALGVVVRQTPTITGTLAVGRSGSIAGRVWSWIDSFVSNRPAPVEVSVDANAVYKVVPKLDSGPRTNPIEPNIKLEGDKLVAVVGVLGKGIDPAEVIGKLPDAARHGLPIVVSVHRGTVHPRFSTSDAEEVASLGERLTAKPLVVSAAGQQATVSVKMLRSWVRAQPTDDGRLDLAVNNASASDDLGKLLPKVGVAPVESTFNVVNGTPQVVPGKPGTACCATSAGSLIDRALRDRPSTPPNLPLKAIDPQLTQAAADSLGIKEQVSTFTTRHLPGEPRVTNIHLIADIVRG